MANTTNLDLVKPAGTDKALVSVINANSDKIDAFAGTTNQALSALTTKATITDCNTYNAEGVGRIIASTANRPFDYGVLKNILYSLTGYRAQLAISVSNQTYAYRTSNDGGSTWSAWKEIALKSEVDLLANRFVPANLNSVQNIINNVSATGNNNISIVGVNSSTCNTLGGGQESGMILCKYFQSDQIINYVIIGRQIAIGKINTSTGDVTIVKTYA